MPSLTDELRALVEARDKGFGAQRGSATPGKHFHKDLIVMSAGAPEIHGAEAFIKATDMKMKFGKVEKIETVIAEIAELASDVALIRLKMTLHHTGGSQTKVQAMQVWKRDPESGVLQMWRESMGPDAPAKI
ncbi:hypothetical protein M427DRAFT_159387 [Gonapodya prolifera JEL478]|uniref:DUF4440 domain-containing protein n=1 Tax=Gonapodya prolifera (strain JEL478) TaxID=1344416 RepID=A0A139A1H8_GONPJ|nr:hypothetical protein M427DRAFT_159387 [Gonapodya prolifera JEL478]|eukprot:KXS10395.1 hypothetical protein M427DRAFT_159387 [Gonapodya prolifera JEL478]